MEDFKKLFKDEAKDLIILLEDSLMKLEEDFTNNDLINEVFRVMHSLKGSGAMFGFTNLSNFTHDLETLFDRIRSNKLALNSEIISFTFNVADHIAELLKDDNNEELIPTTAILKKRIDEYLTFSDKGAEKEIPNNDKPEISSIPDKKIKLYYIRFEPHEDILSDGTNPLYLVDELVDLGDALLKLDCDNLDDFSEMPLDKCKLAWSIILSTSAELSELNDVFIFVDTECNIVIELLSENDLFSLTNGKSTLSYTFNNNPKDLESLKKTVHVLTSNFQDPSPVIIPEAEIDTPNDSDQPSIIEKDQIQKQKTNFTDFINIDTVKVSSTKLDSLINLVSELVTSQARLVNLANETKSTELVLISEEFQQLSRQFRDIAFDMRLIPIQTMVVKFKRLIRDLSKNLDKKVNFLTEGTETEVDKNIIATISDPIMHIIRNAIDHGIETPDIRTKNNKPKVGTIKLEASYSGTSIIIRITDDGAGINKENVIQKAIQKDLIEPGADLSDTDIYNLLLLPGFSTSEVVTDVSGRGVGMDVVRKKIIDLRGEVTLNSTIGKGTEVTIRLPLTLSIIDGLLVSINTDRFVIPLSSVVQIYQVSNEAISKSINNIINIDGVQFPFINLPKVFGKSSNTSEVIHFITVNYHNNIVGLIVNELLSEYQAVLKPIGSIMENNEIFAGASILGDGKVALVLDISKLIDFYSNH